MREQQYTSGPNGIVYEMIELETIGDVAIIDRDRLQSLLEYSTSNPTGAYPNKMWKRLDFETGGWLICEFVDHPTNPDLLRTRVRRAALPETVALVAEGVLWFVP
jgi:hypothetical protein